MRTIKLLVAGLLIGMASTSFAQTDSRADACAHMAKAKAALLTTELALDTGQAAKVHALIAKNEESLVGIRGHCAVMDAKAKKQDEATYASINELLDREQQQRFEALRTSGKLEACGKADGKGCCAGKKDAKAEDVPKSARSNAKRMK